MTNLFERLTKVCYVELGGHLGHHLDIPRCLPDPHVFYIDIPVAVGV